MKFYNYLIEGYLRSEYRIGFELEACYRGSDLSKVHDFFKKHWSIGGTLGEDSSIKPNSSSDIAFEYSTNPFNITPKNIDTMIKMLSKLNQNNIYTNKSCGFHVHMSFPYLKDTDLFWIICNIAVNDDVQNTLLHFKKYDFFDVYQYAKPQFLDDIKVYIENKDMDSLEELYSDEKYRVFRIHPQGTLEWRGPRNFLNISNLKDIKDFIKLLFKFVSLTNNFIDSKVIKIGDTVITRKEFESMFKTGSVIKTKKFAERTNIAELVSNNFNWVLDAKIHFADISVEGENLVWNFGTWENGNWEGGIWKGGEWHQGNWENGIWKMGHWKDGAWKNGTWRDGTWENGIWYKGIWENGTWKDGTWKDGTWKYGVWHKGTWMNGTWKLGVWENGTWINGNWEGGTWMDGTWKHGNWKNGFWKNGTWRDGTWINGTWINGKWIRGHIKTKYGNIKSTKNSKEYNKYINKNPKATKEDLEKYLR